MPIETESDSTGTGPAEPAVNAPTAPDGAADAPSTGPAPDGPTAAVWGALTGSPGATAAAVAAAAGVATTTARKALATLEADGHATRIPGGREGGRRMADTWQPTGRTEDTGNLDDVPDPASVHAVPAGTDTGEADHDRPSTSTTPDAQGAIHEADLQKTKSNTADDGPTSPSGAAGPPDAQKQEGMDAAAVVEARGALTRVQEAITSALQALEAGNQADALAAVEAVYTESVRSRRLVRAATDARPGSVSRRIKSHPGELRAKVAAHLRAHVGQEFTPHEIGKVVGHSSGAVANALDRLVTLGEAVETCERPRRFSAASITATATAPPATP